MVARIIEQFEADIAAHLPAPDEAGHGRPGAFARAYVPRPPAAGRPRARSAWAPPCWPPRRPSRPCSCPLQAAADGWQARLVDDGLDPATATLVRMACDGLWLCDLFGLAPPSADLACRRWPTALDALTEVAS